MMEKIIRPTNKPLKNLFKITKNLLKTPLIYTCAYTQCGSHVIKYNTPLHIWE
jgi:hypothetical protein